jgi:hypothetical protein
VSCESPEREALTFLAAGSLGADEQAAAAAHLAGCADCRAEWPALRKLVVELRELHLTPEEAEDVARRGTRPEHLELCARCSQEVETLRSVQRSLPARPPARVPAWSLAAALTIGVAAGVLLRSAAAPPAAAPSRHADDVRRLAELERRVAQLEGPRLNVPVVELHPDALRSGSAGATRVSKQDERVLLVLASLEERRFDDYLVELVAADGRVALREQGLRRDAAGVFRLELPLAPLAAGRYALRLSGVRGGREERLESYTLLVE